jgi:hypothetical protein
MRDFGGTAGGMLATTQPATPAKHGTTDANSIADVATELTANREPCSCCGSSAWTEGHFVNGSLICSPCAREIRRTQESSPMPPSKSQQMQLADWLRPQRGAQP